jgi:hypothetical protein
MLHKVGVEDNVSYYGNRGSQDFILNIVWNKSFQNKKSPTTFISYLSGSKPPEIKNAPEAENEMKIVTIDDCFDEFKKSEMLDENNMWYCNKCKDHV